MSGITHVPLNLLDRWTCQPLPADLPALRLALRLNLPVRGAGQSAQARQVAALVEQSGRQGVHVRAWWGLRFTAGIHQAESGRCHSAWDKRGHGGRTRAAHRGLAHSEEEPELDGPVFTAVHGESDLYPQHLHGYAAVRVPMLLLSLPTVTQEPTASRRIKSPPSFLICSPDPGTEGTSAILDPHQTDKTTEVQSGSDQLQPRGQRWDRTPALSGRKPPAPHHAPTPGQPTSDERPAGGTIARPLHQLSKPPKAHPVVGTPQGG